MAATARAGLSAARRDAIRRRLLAWWDAGHRPLPWRAPQGEAEPYRVWIAEVMLQQTQVAAAIPYYRRFLARFPTLASLARASEDEVLALWSGLGYYARGRRLLEAARAALARHGGLPASAEALRALPGFGPYTAGAVASIAFGLREPCVDGNVARVLSRVFLVDGPPERPEVRAGLWALAAELVPPARPGDHNQALMELGATRCGRPAPRCPACPLEALCLARRSGRERELPLARARRAPVPLQVACAVVRRGGALLVVRRPSGGLFGGLWALPGVEVRPGEEPGPALRAALAAAAGVRATVGEALASLERELTHRRLRLTAYAADLEPGTGSASRRSGARMVLPEELAELGVPTAMRRLIELLPEPAAVRSAPVPGQGRNRAPEAWRRRPGRVEGRRGLGAAGRGRIDPAGGRRGPRTLGGNCSKPP